VKARRGFVLVAALWLLIALGAVALDVSLKTRARRLASANLLDETRARAAADAAAEYARSRLSSAMLGRAEQLRSEAASRATTQAARDRAGRAGMQNLFQQADPAEDPWRQPEGLVPSSYAVGAVDVVIALRDTGAGLNPNEADEAMIRQFFANGLRLDYALADKLAQAILDWRDQDDLPRVNGGERDQYIEEGAAILPPNRAFATIDELRHVLGMTDEVFNQMRPFLTMVSSGRINLNAAPEPVLLALPGFTPAAASVVMRERDSGRLPRSQQELFAMLPASAVNSIVDRQQEFARRSTYVTSEVEINTSADLPGSPITAHALVVVARATTGATVVWRRVE
jgi:general secretion pathway protein K